MKYNLKIRWWDGIALVLALLAAVIVVNYSMQRSGTTGTKVEAMQVTLRIPKPIPEVAAQLQVGDKLINLKDEPVAEVIAVTRVDNQEPTTTLSAVFGRQDLLVTIKAYGNLRLKRDLPGFPLEPAALKAGVWCLMTTDKVELSGMVVKVSSLNTSGK